MRYTFESTEELLAFMECAHNLILARTALGGTPIGLAIAVEMLYPLLTQDKGEK